MKKIYILLTLLATFFIGSVSVKAAVTCTYTKGSLSLVIEDGIVKTYDNNGTRSSFIVNDPSGELTKACTIELKGFLATYMGGSSQYFLYTSSDYTNDETYKALKQEIGVSISEDIIFSMAPVVEPKEGSVVSCGNGAIRNIPSRLKDIINTIVRIIQIGVPILLIILGMIDFGKSAIAQKEEEMKKGQRIFVSRLITAILVFFVIFFVKAAVRFVNDRNESSKIISCVDCFISGRCD